MKAPGIIGELISRLGGAALARRCFVSRQTIYNWANNRTSVPGEAGARIAVACDENGVKPMLYRLAPSVGETAPSWLAASLPDGWAQWPAIAGGYQRRCRMQTPIADLTAVTAEDLAAAKASGWPY